MDAIYNLTITGVRNMAVEVAVSVGADGFYTTQTGHRLSGATSGAAIGATMKATMNRTAFVNGDWLMEAVTAMFPLSGGRMYAASDMVLQHPDGSVVVKHEYPDQRGEALFRAWRGAAMQIADEAARHGPAPTPKAAAVTNPTPAAPATGSTAPTFTRPNGETYYPTWWKKANDWDVHVLRRLYGLTRKGLFTPVKISGPPGGGKTALVEAAHGVVTSLGGMPDLDTSHLLGKGNIKADGTVEYEWGPLPTAMTHVPGDADCTSHCEQPCGRNVFYYDEMNLSPSMANTPVQMATDGRQRLWTSEHGWITRSPYFHWIVTVNPDVMGAGLLPAIDSRLRFKFDMELDYSVAERLGVDPDVVGWALGLQSARKQGEPIANLPSMRDLLGWRDVAAEFGAEIAWDNLMQNGDLSVQQWATAASERVGYVVEPLVLLAGQED